MGTATGKSVKLLDNVSVTMMPISIHGLPWPVTIFDSHMQIGCELKKISEWSSLDEREVRKLSLDFDGDYLVKFRDTCVALAKLADRK